MNNDFPIPALDIIESEKNAQKKDFSQWLKNGMAARHCSQKALADYLGVSKVEIHNWIYGKHLPRNFQKTAAVIARYLQIPPFSKVPEAPESFQIESESAAGKEIIRALKSIRKEELLEEFSDFVSDKRFLSFLREYKKFVTSQWSAIESGQLYRKNASQCPYTGEKLKDSEVSEILANRAMKWISPLVLDLFKI